MSPPRAPKGSSTAFVRAVGAAVRARRLRLEQTCADLARRSGLSESAIVRVEAGDPTLDLLQLVSIAAGLKIPVSTLLQRAQKSVRWGGGTGTRMATAPGKTRGRKGKGHTP